LESTASFIRNGFGVAAGHDPGGKGAGPPVRGVS
jgi:hypothetical protein